MNNINSQKPNAIDTLSYNNTDDRSKRFEVFVSKLKDKVNYKAD